MARSVPLIVRLWGTVPALLIDRLPPTGTVTAAGVSANSLSSTLTAPSVAPDPPPEPSSRPTNTTATLAMTTASTASTATSNPTSPGPLGGAVGGLCGLGSPPEPSAPLAGTGAWSVSGGVIVCTRSA